MNYYSPRYDLPLVLRYTGPVLYFYSPGSGKTSELIPSFSKQEDLLTKSKDLENETSKSGNDLINTFFSDKVAMLRKTLELAGIDTCSANWIEFSQKNPQQ